MTRQVGIIAEGATTNSMGWPGISQVEQEHPTVSC